MDQGGKDGIVLRWRIFIFITSQNDGAQKWNGMDFLVGCNMSRPDKKFIALLHVHLTA